MESRKMMTQPPHATPNFPILHSFTVPLSQNKRNGRSSARKTGTRKFVQDRVYLRSLIKTIPCLYAEALNSEGMTVFSASNCPSRANLPVMAGQRKKKRKKKRKKEFSSAVNLAPAIKMLRTRGEGEGRGKGMLEGETFRKYEDYTETKFTWINKTIIWEVVEEESFEVAFYLFTISSFGKFWLLRRLRELSLL